MSRVLVTGAGGFIGSRVLAPLTAAGHEVHAVGRSARDDATTTWHVADLTVNPERVVADVRPDALVHLAWYTEHGRFWTAPENDTWVTASMTLLRAFAAHGGVRAVVAGTCAEYDWTTAARTLGERAAPIAPSTPYGLAKAELHARAQRLAAETGLELAWGRVFFPYGAGEDEGRLVTSVARALLSGATARTTDGTQVRDFIYVDDVAGAFAALAASSATGPVNIGTGEPVAVRDVIATIAAAVGAEDRVEFGAIPQRPDEPERIVADVTRLHDEVGFSPMCDLADGIARTVAAMRRAG